MDPYSLASFGWKVPSTKENLLTTANTSAGSFDHGFGNTAWQNDSRLRGYSKIEELPETLRSHLNVLLLGLLESSCCLLRNILLTPARNMNDLRARIVLAESSLANWKREINSSLNFERVVFLQEPRSDQGNIWKLLEELTLVGKLSSKQDSIHTSDVKPSGLLNQYVEGPEGQQDASAPDLLDAYDVKTLDLRAVEHLKPTDYCDSNLFKSHNEDSDFVETISISAIDKEAPRIFAELPKLPDLRRAPLWNELKLPPELIQIPSLTGITSSRYLVGGFSRSLLVHDTAVFYKKTSLAEEFRASRLDVRFSGMIKIGHFLAIPNNLMLLIVAEREILTFSVSEELRFQLNQAVTLSNKLVSRKHCCTLDEDDPTTAILLHMDGACTLLNKGIPQGTFRGFLPQPLLPYIQSDDDQIVRSGSQTPKLYLINVRRDKQLAIAYTLIPTDQSRGHSKRAIVSLLNFPNTSAVSEISGRPSPTPLLLQLEILSFSNEELIGVALSSDAQHILECICQHDGGVIIRVQKLDKDKLFKCGDQLILERSLALHQYPKAIQPSHQTCLTFCRSCEWCRSASVFSFYKLHQDTYALFSLLLGLHILRFVSTTKSFQKVAHIDFDQIHSPVSVMASSEEEVLFLQPQSNSQKNRVWSLKVNW